MPARLTPATRISEKALMQATLDCARLLGWTKVYHTYDSRRSAPGFPDAVLIHPDGRLLVVEFKAERGTVTSYQRSWLDAFERCGVMAAVWRPQQWHDGTIERVLRGEVQA